MELYQFAVDVATNPRNSRWIAPLLILADAILCGLVIWKIPYTEIDWTTYMQQVSQYLAGERDYTAIKGSTGPLVYPAAHVYIYSFLHGLTDEGQDISHGQVLFGILYVHTLAIVLICYTRARVPPYVLPLLVLSKRLHSIYVLRLFNDGIAAFAMWLSILFFQRNNMTAAVALWSIGVGVKMSLLLLAPGIAAIAALRGNFRSCIQLASLAVLIQVLLAAPFLKENATGYISRAFELTRQFLFKWTVNWRFLGEENFLSRQFSVVLIAAHLSLLALFFSICWLRPSGLNPLQFTKKFLADQHPKLKLSDRFVMTTLLGSLTIGLLCARTLHYQFFAYLSWSTPYLLWAAGFHPLLIYAIWSVQEWAWNVYPSTSSSSITVVVCLAIQVAGAILAQSRLDDSKPMDVAEKTTAKNIKGS